MKSTNAINNVDKEREREKKKEAEVVGRKERKRR